MSSSEEEHEGMVVKAGHVALGFGIYFFVLFKPLKNARGFGVRSECGQTFRLIQL